MDYYKAASLCCSYGLTLVKLDTTMKENCFEAVLPGIKLFQSATNSRKS